MTVSQVQAAIALSLALLLHLGAFALHPGPAGASASASGAGGSDLITLQAADGSIADLVATWQEPPQIAASPAPPLPQPGPADSIALPQAPTGSAPDLPALPRPATAPMPDTAPRQAEAPPPPPPPPEPAPKPAPEPAPEATARPPAPAPENSPATPAQQAAGTGSGAAAGQGGTAKASTLSQAAANDALAGWGASIRARIEKRKRYPAAADGASGRVTLRLTIGRNGQLQGVAIAASSGNAALDAAALKAVQSAGRFAKAPSGLTEASYSFSLPMRFERGN